MKPARVSELLGNPAPRRLMATPALEPIAMPVANDKRIHIRFDMLFPVVLASELFGDTTVVARNVSAGGMMVQSPEVLPLGAVVTVHFQIGDGDDAMVAQAEVKHHLCLNFAAPGAEPQSARAMGLRFLDFDTELPLSLPAHRVLH
jgi:PilZ domain